MKLSVSLPAEDVAFLDAYASVHACASRSAAVHQAIRALRVSDLHDAYGDAWAHWSEGGEADVWDVTADDGL
ncbi:MAG TPA: ribbon-helix-helix domain-containing protein [Conexibacter sp.]|nr:ribbon-helix-helix domain-containing protein [Conexibacter sp.]